MTTGTAETNGQLWGARARDWAEVQEGQFAAAYHAVLSHVGVRSGTRHLDAGCGAGMAAALSASLGATVAGIDAAEGMLEIARERTPLGDFRQGEIEALPFDDNAFDLVTGFNAFQFAGDPAGALREAGRVTRPEGKVVITTWGDPEGMEAAAHIFAMKPLLPAPPPGAPGPFALSDETALRAFATAGGLRPVEVIDVDTPWFYRDEATALRGLGSSGVAVRAIGHSGKRRSFPRCAAFSRHSDKPTGATASAPVRAASWRLHDRRGDEDRGAHDDPAPDGGCARRLAFLRYRRPARSGRIRATRPAHAGLRRGACDRPSLPDPARRLGRGAAPRHRAGRWPSASLAACGSRRATASPASSGPAQSGGGGVAGAGHRTTVIGDEDVRLAIVQLPPQPGDATKEDDP